jgi:hypothetical protein
VLLLAVLDHEPERLVVAVHWQGTGPTVSAGIPEQPVEAVLPRSELAEGLVAQVEDIFLVTHGPQVLVEQQEESKKPSNLALFIGLEL